LKILPFSVALSLGDTKYILNRNDLKIRKKFYWLYYSFVRNFFRVYAGYLGGKYHLMTDDVKLKMDKQYSMQYVQKNKT